MIKMWMVMVDMWLRPEEVEALKMWLVTWEDSMVKKKVNNSKMHISQLSKSSLPEVAAVASDLEWLVCIISKVNGCLKLRFTYKITTFGTPPRVKPAFLFADKDGIDGDS